MSKQKRTLRDSSKTKVSPFKDYWNKYNYYFFYAGITTIFIGFYLMSYGPWDNPISLTISPIVLLIGYLFIIPLAILFRGSNKKDKSLNDPSKG